MNKSLEPVHIFWFRRDLRIEDNLGLAAALASGRPVLPIFIFDAEILRQLNNPVDRRVQFIHQSLNHLNEKLQVFGSGIFVFQGRVEDVWQEVLAKFRVEKVFFNRDYEPSARRRDEEVGKLCASRGVNCEYFDDQVIFSPEEVLKSDDSPYTVFTPYMNAWLKHLEQRPFKMTKLSEMQTSTFFKFKSQSAPYPDGFKMGAVDFKFPERVLRSRTLVQYAHDRNDLSSEDSTSKLGVHLRFGTLSIRRAVEWAQKYSAVWLSELIWREFFMMLIWHFPQTVNKEFRSSFDAFKWRNDEAEFRLWSEGRTGYPIVDAGIRELLQTGYMHNRARMITASFLAKHLLLDWRKGERFFAEHLLDFELASNVGNWQWVAGCGCDAAPYFRIFNPVTQQQKFDPDFRYVRRWVREYGSPSYSKPMIEHVAARERALRHYAKNLSDSNAQKGRMG